MQSRSRENSTHVINMVLSSPIFVCIVASLIIGLYLLYLVAGQRLYSVSAKMIYELFITFLAGYFCIFLFKYMRIGNNFDKAALDGNLYHKFFLINCLCAVVTLSVAISFGSYLSDHYEEIDNKSAAKFFGVCSSMIASIPESRLFSCNNQIRLEVKSHVYGINNYIHQTGSGKITGNFTECLDKTETPFSFPMDGKNEGSDFGKKITVGSNTASTKKISWEQ